MPARTAIVRGGIIATLSLAAACGSDTEPPVRLIGGVHATTDLRAATGLPPASVQTVVRAADGWRVLYRGAPGAAPAVAANLCRLEGRAPAAIRREPIADAGQLPGAMKITITCRG